MNRTVQPEQTSLVDVFTRIARGSDVKANVPIFIADDLDTEVVREDILLTLNGAGLPKVTRDKVRSVVADLKLPGVLLGVNFVAETGLLELDSSDLTDEHLAKFDAPYNTSW